MSTLKTNRIEPVGSTAGTVTVDGTMVFTQGATFPGGISVGQFAYFSTGVTVAGTVMMSSPFSFRNRIMNGNMMVNQRGTTSNPNVIGGNGFGPTMGQVNISGAVSNRVYDRWTFQRSPGITLFFYGGLTVSPPQGFDRYCRLLSGATTTSYANTSVSGFYQGIETSTISDFDYGKTTAKTSTLSFWVRSNRTGTFEGNISSFPNSTRGYLFPYTINSADTWEYKTITIPGDTASVGWTYSTLVNYSPSSNAGGFAYIGFNLGSGASGYGTRNQWQTRDGVYLGYSPYTDGTGVQLTGWSGGYLDFTGVQWELGNVATPFEHRPYAIELEMCQRYFFRSIFQNFAGYSNTSVGEIQTVGFPTRMRAHPTTSAYSSQEFSFTNCSAGGANGLASGHDNYQLSLSVTSLGAFQFNANNGGFDYIAEI